MTDTNQTQTNAVTEDLSEVDQSPIEGKKKNQVTAWWQAATPRNKLIVLASTVVCLVMISGTALAAYMRSTSTKEQSNIENAQQESTPSNDSATPLEEDIETNTGTATPAASAQPTPSSSALPSPTATVVPTSKPENPPRMRISFPTNGQHVEQESGTVCVVDTPQGGDTSGLMRRHRLQGGDWTDYEPFFTLCYQPANGPQKIALQYKNSKGEASGVHNIEFTFTKKEKITVKLSATAYIDKNCNAKKDDDETRLETAFQGHVLNENYNIVKQFSTSNDGSYTHSEKISFDETIKRRISFTAPSGYKSNPDHNSPLITFSEHNTSENISLPFVPNDMIENCM